MAIPRSPLFDGVDPELVNLIQTTLANYAPYKGSIISGYRPPGGQGGQGFHPKGQALDVQLTDPKTGQPLKNYQDPTQAQAYQAFANQVYQNASPEMKAKLRWGGYFNEGGPGHYGSLDLMHFDTGGQQVPMAGGSWAGGFSPEQQKQWGLSGPGTGVGATAGQMTPAATAAPQQGPPDYRTAFLNTIAGPESGGRYNVMYGGQQFNDYSKHPGVRVPMNGPGGNYSTAAGKYQFIQPTWDAEAQKLGLSDFSPQNQDKAAWDLASTTYSQKTGRDLDADLRAGNTDYVQSALGDTWTSLQKGGFSDSYKKMLAGGAQATTPGAGLTPPPPTTPGASATSTTDKPDPNKDAFDIMGAMKDIGKSLTAPPEQQQQQPYVGKPGAVMVQAPMMPNPQNQTNQRDQLAVAMARLNSGRLY